MQNRHLLLINYLETNAEKLFKDSFFKTKLKHEIIKNFQKEFDLTNDEVLVFSIITYEYLVDGTDVGLSRVKEKYNISQEEYFKVLDIAKSLVKKRLIGFDSARRRSKELYPYVVLSDECIESIVYNRSVYDDVNFSDIYSVLDMFVAYFNQLEDDKISSSELFQKINNVLKRMPMTSEFKLITKDYSDVEIALIAFVATFQMNGRMPDVDDFMRYALDKTSSRAEFMKGIIDKTLKPIENKVIELKESGGFFSRPSLRLTKGALNKIFGLKKKKTQVKLNIEMSKHIKASTLKGDIHLSDEQSSQINNICEATIGKKYAQIRKELKANNFPLGLTVLLYGGPGTGKTASAYDISKKSSRDILQVDIANIRDKYVGESEKRLKQIFEEYREACTVLAKTPILLFNEADALIGKRVGTQGSVDVMNNSMQNILLEELENFDGILIATTNLTENMDDAFSRRFLYKVEFQKPTKEVRVKIWKSKIDQLTNEQAENLSKYDISGAQIELVARKFLLDKILHNKEMDINLIDKMVKDEINYKSDEGNKMGFLS